MPAPPAASMPKDTQAAGQAPPGLNTAAGRPFLAWLARHRQEIIEDWVDRLSRLSPSYRQRPLEELYGTVTGAFEANWEALDSGGLERIERFINYITQKRLQAGFPLSDVQKAFELFRTIVVELMRGEGRQKLLAESMQPLNACLSYTIHRFSDHFQHMHERAIRHYAKNLQVQIQERTAELAESERRYKTLVEEINDGYFVIQDEHIVLANQAFCHMHGARLDQVLGRHFLAFVDPQDQQRVLASYNSALAQQPLVGQLEYLRQGCPPEQAHTEIKSRVVDLGQGPVTIGICRDISARVAMEAKIRDHERMAYVGHLTASLSHEIRNPLSSIKMNLQLLARRLRLDGYDQRRLEITVQQVSRLEGILHQLLDTARPLCLQLAPVDLAGLTRGCVDLLEPKASEKQLVVTQRHRRNLPLIQADAGRLEQAVINLLLNAIEAAPLRGKITVWTKGLSAGSQPEVELGVSDNGPGVDPEQMANLFTPFHTSKSQGTGLGLSNVKRIMEAHQGRVEVSSRPGRGATFTLRLPCPA